MSKVGRNKPCPCGSGKKFKRCHGKLTNPLERDAMALAFQRLDASEIQRKQQQGLGKPIISDVGDGHRLVAVGNRMYFSEKWRTFHDFLRDFLIGTLGREWFKEQIDAEESKRHTVVNWYMQSLEDARELHEQSENGLVTGPMTGAQRAFLNLAYNIYLIAHHSDPQKSEKIVDSFIWRLKSARKDDFLGKLFETYTSAVFLKAGFEIEYENERDGLESHVEFVATYPESKKKFSVEVKTRNPQASKDGPVDDIRRLRVGSKLTRALRKRAKHMRVVFIEVNVPDVITDGYKGTWMESALQQIWEAESYRDREGKLYPPSYVCVTNHAFHNHLSSTNIGIQAIAEGFRIANFGVRAQVNRLHKYLENLEEHKEILQLFDSLKQHSTIPTTFDGEIPEFAFEKDDKFPRLVVGNQYLIPDGKGNSVVGTLRQAIVMEAWGNAQAIYELEDGRSVRVSHELTDREWRAWKRHPETFFGSYKEKQKEPENWIELAEFFYRSYRHTDKERLLEFMKDSDNIEQLRTMTQDELAVSYCEMTAWSIWSRRDRRDAAGKEA